MKNNGQPSGQSSGQPTGTPDAGLSASDTMMAISIGCLAMSINCSDAGAMRFSDAGPDGGSIVVGKDAAPTGLTDGAVAPQDASSKDQMPQMPNDGNIAIPDPMSVMRRMKTVPKHVAFVDSQARIYVSGRNATIGGKGCQQGALGPLYSPGGGSATSVAWNSVQMQYAPRSTPQSIIIPTTMMTDNEMAKLNLRKAPVKNFEATGSGFIPMSIEDWILANINDLENAIVNSVAAPGDCL